MDWLDGRDMLVRNFANYPTLFGGYRDISDVLRTISARKREVEKSAQKILHNPVGSDAVGSSRTGRGLTVVSANGRS